jgi:hypothetical protein
MLRRVKQATLVTALAASVVAFAPVAHAERVDFSIAIGGPGYALAFGHAPYRAAVAWRPHGYRGGDDGPRYDRRDDDSPRYGRPDWGRPHYVHPQWHPGYASRPVGYFVSAYAPPVVYAPPVAHAPRVVYVPRVVRPPRIAYRGPHVHRPFNERRREHRGDRDRD